MLVKIPEEVGVYKSILSMSISRGDLSGANLAYSYLLADHFEELKDCIISASLFRFSVLPEEVLSCSEDSIWKIISGMCNSLPDYRALSLSSLYFNRKLPEVFPGVALQIKPFLTKLSNSFLSYRHALTLATVSYLGGNSQEESCILDDIYFSCNSIEGPIEPASNIPACYYLGPESWVRPFTVSFLSNLLGSNKLAVSCIDYFEYYKTTKELLFEEYWIAAKEAEFENVSEREKQWELKHGPEVEEMINEFLLSRLPIP